MKKSTVNLLIIAFILSIYGCSDDDIPMDIVEEQRPNILLIIADDMGLDACPGYDIGDVKPNMPILESFIKDGVQFSNVWSYPTCTPTRSSIITGKYGFKTDVLKVGDELSTDEKSIHRLLDEQTNSAYNHAVIGKWHLSNDENHPLAMGLQYYAGLLSGAVASYTDWNFTENGSTTNSKEYTTSKFTDLAIDWVGDQTKPWFLWLAYNAPHTPFHLPPNELHSQGALPSDQSSIDANPLPYFMAALEAMDAEIGRLLSSMDQSELDNTIVIFIGDNGSPNQVAQTYNSHRVKGTVYQGGVNVPMIVSGKGVDRNNEKELALINTADLFATIADIAETGISEINDSKSFVSLLSDQNAEKRDYVYTEIGRTSGDGDYTIRDLTHKYIFFEDGTEALYNLQMNGLENPNLLSPNQLPLSVENALKLEELKSILADIRND